MKLCFSVLILAALSCYAPASPITWLPADGGNGHAYEILAGGYYPDMLSAAAARTWNGVQGRLAVIPDLITQDWLLNTFAADFGPSQGIWIGLYKNTAGVPDPNEGTWTWTNGVSPLSYNFVSWAPGYPADGWAGYLGADGLWYSSAGSWWRLAVVEYGAEEAGETPELATMLMLASGLAMLGWRRARIVS